MTQTARPKPLSYSEFAAIYSRVPRLTVEVLVVKPKRGVLLLKRQEKSWHGQWHIPGGSVFYQESVTDTVRRIAQEELSLNVQVEKLLGYIEYPSEIAERGFGWSIGLSFLCRSDEQIMETENMRLFATVPPNTISDQIAMLNQALSYQ